MANKYLDISGLTYLWGRLKATFAPKNSPAFTGTPTAPTASASTNNTQLATTAFVKTAVASGYTAGSGIKIENGVISVDAVTTSNDGGGLTLTIGGS